MEMFNKLKSTVSTTLSTVQTALVNPLPRDYEVGGQLGSAGPGLLWKVCQCTKKSTKQELAAFTLEKKQLDKFHKNDRELILDILRKGVQQLTRLRHPKILTVDHGLEESREMLAFVTEPVFTSVSNVLGKYDNLTPELIDQLKTHQLYDIEIRYGLLQVSEGLAFLHNDVRMLHGNISPQNIIINKQGSWKLMGLEFSRPSTSSTNQTPVYQFQPWPSEVPSPARPDLDYLAPEYGISQSCDAASDMFSMGVLIFAVFNHGKPFYTCNEIFSTYKKNIEQLRTVNVNNLKSVPDELRDAIKMLLNSTPTVRPDADQLSKIPYFQDVGAMTLQYLDSLLQWDNLARSQFYKGLPKVLTNLPKRILLQRVLPCLVSEIVNPDMVPFILPAVLTITESCSSDEFTKQVLPSLLPVFNMTHPIQISYILLQKMDLLLNKTPADQMKNHVLPMVYRALEADSIQIQELCLNIIPTFSHMVAYSTMKHSVIPRIRTLCLETSSLPIRVNSLVTIGKILETMDKWYVLEEILPMLRKIPSREPAVLMAILGIHKIALTHKKLGMTKELLTTDIIPYILPLSVDNSLNLSQFNAYINLVKDMVDKIETEQRAKLEQLSSMEMEQRSTLSFTGNKPQQSVDNMLAAVQPEVRRSQETSDLGDVFEELGLGGYLNTRNKPPPSSQEGPAPSNGGGGNSGGKVCLTMDEKIRLQKDQEIAQRMGTGGPLLPKSNPPPSVKTTTTKDLTSTLDNKINLAASQINSNTGGQGQQQRPGSIPFPNYSIEQVRPDYSNVGPMAMQIYGPSAWSATQQQQPSYNPQSMGGTNISGTPVYQRPNPPPPTAGGTGFIGQRPPLQNMASLDSLDIFGKGQQRRVPMNQLQQQQQQQQPQQYQQQQQQQYQQQQQHQSRMPQSQSWNNIPSATNQIPANIPMGGFQPINTAGQMSNTMLINQSQGVTGMSGVNNSTNQQTGFNGVKPVTQSSSVHSHLSDFLS